MLLPCMHDGRPTVAYCLSYSPDISMEGVCFRFFSGVVAQHVGRWGEVCIYVTKECRTLNNVHDLDLALMAAPS